MALELSGISFAYAAGTPMEQPALVDVSARVEPGRMTLVAGATGSGKSTLLRAAAGLLRPQSGAMTLDGTAITGVVAGSARGVGIAFQSPESQLFAETVAADVGFGPRNQGLTIAESDERVRAALDRVGLAPDDFADRSPFALSGGEARRAALAGVLALDPAYLLLDEPTAGLDAEGRAAVMTLVRDLRSSTGIMVVSHDIEEFLAVADSVLLLRDGRVSYSGDARTVVEDPRILSDSGLSVPPVLDVLQRIRSRAATIDRMTLDPHEAAAMLISAREHRR